MHLLPPLGLVTHQICFFSSILVTTLSISSPKNSDRAASVPRLPSITVDSSANALNSSYVATTKPLSIKTSKSLVSKSLAPLRTSSCINSSVSKSVSNGTKEVVDRDSLNSTLGNFSSFVTTKCFPTILSFLVSFLALCYPSKLLLFYLVFLTFLIRYFLLNQSSCVVLILNFLIYIFLLILFSIRRYTNFQKRLNFSMYFYGFLLRKISEMLQFSQYAKPYEGMENVGIASFYIIGVLASTITMRLLFLDVLCGDESLISVFRFLCKAIVPVYWSAYLPLLLSKKILSCSLRFIKFLILNALRLIVLFLRFLFYLVVLYLLSVHLTSNMSLLVVFLMIMLVLLLMTI